MATTTHSESLSELERQAESTRAELAQTVDALHNRVSPAALKEDMRGYVRERSQHMMGRLESYARDNPLQAAAMAAGVAWPVWQMVRRMPAPLLLIGAGLALSRRSGGNASSHYMREEFTEGNMDRGMDYAADYTRRGSSSESMTDKMSSMASDAADTVKDASHRVTDTVRDAGQRMTETVADTLSSARDTARDTASTLSERMTGAYRSGAETAQQTAAQARTMMNQAANTATDTMDRQPLLIGAVAFALGSLLASALPVTRQENRLMGQAADELKRRGAVAGGEAMERARQVSSDLYHTARDEIREQGFSPDAARNTVRAAADRLSDEAQGLMEGKGQSGAPSGSTTTSFNPTSDMENGNG